ncbi:MAG: response regulator transcription factor [Agathobacter sp.]
MSYKILIADDEPEIRSLLRLYLENEHYEIIEAEDGQQALDLLRREKPDLCILDIMMPKMDGFHVLQEIRRESNVPVMILSAKDADSEKILGLNLGADDYLAKPFNPLEAVARVNSNIRRFYALGTGGGETDRKVLKVRDLALDEEACILKKGEETIELTSVEYRIMELFMEHPGKVFTKQQIYEQGWGEEYVVADNNIMVCISKLRAKLDGDSSAYIRTIRGLGYRLEK